MTFREYVEGCVKLLKEHPEWGDMPMMTIETWEGDDVTLPEISNSDYFPENTILV